MRAYVSYAMSAPAPAWSASSLARMSVGTGTSSVASSGTNVTGTSSARTSATESGSAPTFHSIPSDGAMPATSMLPATPMAPAIASDSGHLRQRRRVRREQVLEGGPRTQRDDRHRRRRGVDDLGEEVFGGLRKLGAHDRRQHDAVHVVAGRAPVVGERDPIRAGIVPATCERDLGPPEGGQDPAHVPQPRAAVDEPGPVDGDRADVHGGIAKEHVDREQVVHAHVGRDDDRPLFVGLHGGGRHGGRVGGGGTAGGDERERSECGEAGGACHGPRVARSRYGTVTSADLPAVSSTKRPGRRHRVGGYPIRRSRVP